MLRYCHPLFICCIAAYLSTACGEARSQAVAKAAHDPSADVLPALSPDLRVMSFNIWGGGVGPQFEPTVAAIRQSEADIVALQETNGTIPKFATALGFYGSPNTNLLSRYPIVAEFADGEARTYGAKIELPAGRIVYVFNSHLTAYPYTPHEVRDGRPAWEEQRIYEARRALRLMDANVDPNSELLFAGDHNTVSHNDWAGRGYDLPVSEAIAAFGLRDSFREVYPDITRFPGVTWSPGYPGRPENDTNDRIDYIYYRGVLLEAIDSRVHDQLADGAAWPSDHRAVTTDFRFRR